MFLTVPISSVPGTWYGRYGIIYDDGVVKKKKEERRRSGGDDFSLLSSSSSSFFCEPFCLFCVELWVGVVESFFFLFISFKIKNSL